MIFSLKKISIILKKDLFVNLMNFIIFQRWTPLWIVSFLHVFKNTVPEHLSFFHQNQQKLRKIIEEPGEELINWIDKFYCTIMSRKYNLV